MRICCDSDSVCCGEGELSGCADCTDNLPGADDWDPSKC